MRFLRQSTASQEILLGPFVATADGSAQTGLTIANTDIKLLKGGATSEANKNSGGGTHIAGGRYSAVLDATDTNTVGILEVSVNPASGIPWNKSYYVLEEAVYDMLFAASALGYIANAPVNVAQFGGSNGTFASGRPEVNTTLIEGSDATNQIRDAVVDDATRIDASALNTLSSHDPGEAIMGATDLGTGSGLTSLATATELAKVPKSDGTATWNATALAAIQSEANDAIVANHLDHLLATTYDPASKPGAADALLNELVESDGGVARFTANALEEGPGGGSAPTAEEIADAVWTEAVADHSGVSGSTAEALAAAGGAGDPWITALPGSYSAGQAGYIVGTNLNATVSSRASQTSVDTIDDLLDTEVGALTTELAKVPKSDSNVTWNATALASINAQADTALADYDGPTNAEMVARTLAAASYATAAAQATAQADLDTLTGTDGVTLATSQPNYAPATAASVAALNDLSSAEAQSAAAAALTSYDPPTRAELTSDTNSVLSAIGDVPTNAELATALDPLPTAAENAAAVLAATVEGSVTVVQSIRLANAALGGKASGLETTEATYRDLGDTKDRIVATVDSDGNRTAVTRDLT